MFTFEMLFPSVEPGGIYVVEDLHFHAGAMREHARGHAQVNPIDYFQALARAVILNELPAEQQWGFQAYALRTIDEVVFFGHAIAIKKKKLRIETADRTLQVTRMAEAANTADGWERAARYLAGNHDREAAMSALQRAINLAPNPRLFRQLSQHHAEMGDLGRAIETARQSVALASAHERGECLEIYGDILLRAERRDESQDAYKEAATLVQHPVVLARIEQKIHRFSNG
jgi:tetratricopeptide (TPR) repeat protein